MPLFLNAQKLFICLLTIGFIMQAAPAFAMKITPQNQAITLSEGLTAQIQVENTRDAPLTAEFSIHKRHVHEDGTETRTDASSDFLIFPPQALIQPNKTQTVRVQWVGDVDLDASHSYHIFSEEVLVNLSNEPVQGLRAKMAVGVTLHVVPDNVSHDISIANVTAAGDKARITIVNNGNAFGYLDNARITLNADGRTKLYEGIELVQLAERTFLPHSGKKRTISLPLPEGANGSNVQATIEMLDD